MPYIPPEWFETPEERAARMRNASLNINTLPNFPGFGSGEPSFQANHGSAPYEGSGKRAALRYLAGALAGLGGSALRPGAGFGQSLGLGFVASRNQFDRARQAAQDYAEKQAQQEIQRQNAETQRMLAESNAKAKPEKPPKLEPWQLSPEEQDAIIAFEARRAKALAAAKPQPAPKAAPQAKAPKPTPPPKPSSGQERTALAYYNRMKDAEATIGTLETKISKQSPLDQIRLQSAPNYLQSSDQQVYRQAQRAFTEARLRKESGAAIPQQEYDNDARTYFAQPGDQPAVVARKKAARKAVLEGLKFSAGKAYGEFYGSGADSSSGAADLIYNPATGELEPAR